MDIEEIKPQRSISLVKTCIIFFISVVIIFTTARYMSNDEFRSSINRNVFKSEVSEDTLKSIDIDNNTNVNIYAYDKYITVLAKNLLSQYDETGDLVSKLDVNISVPIMDSAGKFLAIAENSGQKIYLVSGKEIVWERELEGEISRVSVNEKGFVSVIIKNTAYKSKIIVFDNSGTDLFTIFLHSNYAICTDISDNSKYLAVGEVSYSGTIVKSSVHIYSMEKAQTDPKNAVINSYEADSGELIIGINYNGSDTAVCMFNSYVQKVTKDSNERLYDMTPYDSFVDISLDSEIAIINRSETGLFSYEYQIDFKNTLGKSERVYILNQDVPNFVVSNNNKIAVNLGREVEFIKTSGWLKKKYISNTTVNSVVLGDSIAGIVYKNKIVIISL